MDFCRLSYNDFTNSIESSGPVASSESLKDIIEDDKRYGVMVPRNGKYFTFQILDTQDNEITEKMLNRGVKLAWKSWTLRLNFDVRQAKSNEEPDFRILIRKPEDDERGVMKKNTIMYHYFPISRLDHPNRGLCVINPEFHYTTHGNPVPLHIIDPVNYPTPTESTGRTIDLDAVLRHEFGHGIGLPHDPVPDNTMSTPYQTLNEFLAERDVYRGIQKYGIKQMRVSRFKRWLKWLRIRSERY